MFKRSISRAATAPRAIIGIWLAAMACASAQDAGSSEPSASMPADSSAPPDSQPLSQPAAEQSSGQSSSGDTTAQDSKPVAPKPEELATMPVPESAPAKEPENEKATQLEDVVVTATKREKSLRDIPASISAFDGDKLEAQGKLGLNDYLQEKPGVTMSEIAPSVIRVTVRGISTDTNPVTPVPSATGLFIGDVPFTDAYIANVQPDLSAFDLSSVELMQGPQGTLFGGAALSGAVRFVLQDPEMGTWSGRSFTQYVAPKDGSTALTSGVALNVPVYSDRFALRLGYVKRKYPGIVDWTRDTRKENVADGGGDQVRGILQWQALDSFGVKLTHLDQDFSAPNEITVSDTRSVRETSRQLLPRPVNNKFKMDSLGLNYDFDAWRIVSLSSKLTKNFNVYSDLTSVYNGPPPQGTAQSAGTFLFFTDNSKAFAQELRVQSTNSEGFQWLAGVYYYTLDVSFIEFIDTIQHQSSEGHSGYYGDLYYGDYNAQKSAVLYASTVPNAQEKAFYFDLTQTVFERLELSAGARLYKTRVHGGFFGTGVLVNAENNGQDINYSNNDISEKGVSPKFSATYHYTPSLATYMLASRGFRFGGLQSIPSTPQNNVPPAYKSDIIWNYELGLRTAWLGNTLHFDPTLFFMDYANPQVVQSTQGIPLGYTDNVGHAVSRGAEASLRWLTPLSGLILELDGGLTDAHTTVPYVASGGILIPAGTKLPGSAASQYSAAVDYLMPWFTAFTAAAHAGYTYVGKGTADLPAHIPVNDYGTVNAGLVLGTSIWSFQPKLALNVSNLTNVTVATWGQESKPLSQGAPYYTYILNQPRTFTARLSVDF